MDVHTQSDKMISFRASANWKARIQRAAEAKDGGNITRLLKRAVDKLIAEEQLLQSEDVAGKEVA